MSRAERRTKQRIAARAAERARMARHTPGALARHPGHLADNPNEGKRDASPLNWSRREIAHETIRQPDAALVVKTPLRTDKANRVVKRAGVPQYSSYTIGTNLPMPIVKTS